MSSKQPIRVGFFGLGIADPSAPIGPGLWAAHAHLPYLLASPAFTITAVSNSTAASAQASIDHYALGANVKAYGSPEDLAADPNVDLVVVCVRIATHYALTKPALLAGKSVFVEWPLAATLPQATELAALAAEKGVSTIVGVQARASPLITKLRSILANNELGTILSSTVTGTFSSLPHDKFPAGADYYLDMNSGGNMFTITFGRFLDSFTHVLGPFSPSPSDLNAVLDTKYPLTKLVDFSTGEVKNTIKRTSPDHVFVQGKLASGALASLAFRTVPTKQVQESGLTWTITGSEGELSIEAKVGQFQILAAGDCVVKMRKGDGEVETIDLGREEGGWGEGKKAGGNVERVYGAWLRGERGGYADFGGAVETQGLLERIRGVAGW